MQKEIKWLLKEKYHGKAGKQFKKDVARIRKGEPVDYVIGFKEFLGCKIDLSKKTLIPRPETEYWADQAIKTILAFCRTKEWCSGRKIKVLDIFAGSGCVGVAVLANVYCATVDFAEKDAKALSQIRINLEKNISLIRANKGWKKECRVIKSDVFSKIKDKYDFIFANPPYIPTKNRKKVSKSVLKYEPKMALFGGKEGLLYVKKFLKQAKKHLNPGGQIWMEFDGSTGSPQAPPQKNKIAKLLKKFKYKNYEFYKDQFGKWRWIIAQ